MAEIDEILNRRAEQEISVDEQLNRQVPGLSAFNPIQEQHPKIPNSERLAIMSAGGGGEAGARSLKNLGLEVVHQGGMNYSVREPGKEWMVLDPEHKWMSPSTWELKDFTSDIAGDVGSIVSMGVGGVKGAIGGFGVAGPPGAFVGGVLGAGVGGGAAQVARTGVGAATGLSADEGEAQQPVQQYLPGEVADAGLEDQTAEDHERDHGHNLSQVFGEVGDVGI